MNDKEAEFNVLCEQFKNEKELREDEIISLTSKMSILKSTNHDLIQKIEDLQKSSLKSEQIDAIFAVLNQVNSF